MVGPWEPMGDVRAPIIHSHCQAQGIMVSNVNIQITVKKNSFTNFTKTVSASYEIGVKIEKY